MAAYKEEGMIDAVMLRLMYDIDASKLQPCTVLGHKVLLYYDAHPNSLCRGTLFMIIDDVAWSFGYGALSSSGRVRNIHEGCGGPDIDGFHGEEGMDKQKSESWNIGDYVVKGPWRVGKWPDGFPVGLKAVALQAVDELVPRGCCGGCL